ncbi:Uncharacterized iron-regulated membrane protein [Parapedobacter composti]|uniref:Uncharacterized iron-regulated membrane protein n=1 Tax=Parapedobacter composti TaxID=623281 RepID=A0A1I1M995_9SPHI|nr:PepSY-associated TM helix domain-containing protein [Parapedobacter composti]SFC82087.1 Uncharacterized iron-regulated membrane protein [Parapedobacter composti]
MAKRVGNTESNGKKLFWRLHHWVGLYTGVLIGILSLTGAAAVFIPEIDRLIVKHRYDAASTAPASIHRFALSVDSLARKYPDYRSLAVILPEHREEAVRVDLIRPSQDGAFTRYDVFIDGGKDRIIGQRDHQNSLANFLRQIHVRLYDGYWGRQLVGIGGLALAVVAITGLLIYGNFMKKQTWPRIRKNAATRVVMADWHKLIGISAMAFNLVIALTGAWLGLQPWIMRWFDIQVPNAFKPPIVMDAEKDKAMQVHWIELLKASEREFPELQPRYLVPSANGSGTVTVRGNIPGLVYERDINILVLSKIDYSTIFKYDIREQPFGHRFYFVQEALHFGDFGGLALKALYALLGLTSGFLSISGFAIFLFRKRKKKIDGATPWKTIFVYSVLTLLFLTVIAFISLFIGYAQASFAAGIIVNGLLMALIGFAIVRYLVNRRRKSSQAAQ